MRDSLVDPSDRRQRATGVAMALDPIRAEVQERAIGRRGLLLTAAIAEHPGANVQISAIAAAPWQGAATVLGRLIASALVEQRFRRPATGPGV